jgi:subtilisin family serine protease
MTKQLKTSKRFQTPIFYFRIGRAAAMAASVLMLLAIAFIGCRQAALPEGWLGDLYEEGRAIFHQTIKDKIAVHSDRAKLTEAEIAKILEIDTRFPRLYGLMVNIFYLKDEPTFRELLEKGDRKSAGSFAEMYREIARFAGDQFVEAFFMTDWNTEHARSTYDKYKDLDAVDLVVRSIGYDANLDIPEIPEEIPPLDQEFRKQGGLAGANFPKAHEITLGKGVKIAILDTGIDESHPVFANTRWGKHFSLVGHERPPWDDDIPAVDWGWHGTLIASVAAIYAPEAELTIYKFADGELQNDPAYQLLMQSMVAACIFKAVHDGNHIISISASGASLDADYLREAVRYAEEQNRIVVSGNLYSKWQKLGAVLNFPGQYETVVSVTAAQPSPSGRYAYWDICAPDETTGLAAPNDIFGAFPTYITEEKDIYIPSISAAIPVVSSLFALTISVYPPLGTEPPGKYAETVRRLVFDNADPSAVGFEGFSPECGYGLINAGNTVKAALELAESRKTSDGSL